MRIVRTRPRALSAVLASMLAVGLLQTAPAAEAAVTGSLVERAICFDSSNPDCKTFADLDGVAGVVVSPDGKNVYVTDYDAHNVSWFARSLTGTLTRSAGACVGATAGCRIAHGLTTPREIVISPDGNFVYAVTGAGDGGVLTFQRELDGSLTQLALADGCLVASVTPNCVSDPYLTFAFRMALSPNGLQLYVTTDAGRLVTLTRNPATGVLTHSGCLSSNPEGPDCPQVVPLAGVRNLATSRDGKSLYTVGQDETGTALARFDRAPDGSLDYVACRGPGGGCTAAVGIDGFPEAVEVSPDGKSLYVGAAEDSGGTVAVFNRSLTGGLSQPTGTARCISETGNGGVCANGHGIGSPLEIAIAADGRSLYMTAQSGTQGVVVLVRAGSGLLTQPAGAAGCVSDVDDYTDGCAEGKAVFQANGVAVSRDGNSVYVGGYGNGGLSNFKRISPPQTTITSGPSGETKDRTPTFKFTSSEKNSTFQCRVDDNAWKSCTSPRTLGKLSFGRHVFKVRAKDVVGTLDPTPAKRRIKVIRS